MTDPSLSIDRETFREHAAAADGPAVIRVAAELDVETSPIEAYAALADRNGPDDPADHAFLLESAEKTAGSDPGSAFQPASADPDRHARYSFVGYDPDALITIHPESGPGRDSTVRLEGLGDAGDTAGPAGTIAVPLIQDGLAEIATAPDVDDPDPLDLLRAAMPDVEKRGFAASERQHLDGGLVGVLAYDAVYDLWLDEVGVERPESRYADARFLLNTTTLVFDEVAGTLELVCTPIVGGATADGTDDNGTTAADSGAVYDAIDGEAVRVADALESATEPETGGFVRSDVTSGAQDVYEDAIRQTKEAVLDGEIYQGVISRERRLTGDVDPLGLYEALREINPSPYMYLLGTGELTVVGASPETLVSVRESEVTVNPIAGTCQRGESPVEDRRLAGEMLADGKERAEHTMLVDLARNDVRRVGQPGSVRVPEFMNVLKYSHVQHIESTVTAELADDADAFDATRATFPAGTLSGAPKIRAMEIIDDLETTPRGPYGGAVGYFSWGGDADLAIVIRTATIEHRASEDATTVERESPASAKEGDRPTDDADRIVVRAGAGIVADSVPVSEYEETEKKMDGVLAALDRIEATEPEVVSDD